MRLNPSIKVPNGYRFTDSEGVRHFGTTLEGLVESLRAYRRRLDRPEGDPLAEVVAQICARHPRCCTEGEPELPVSRPVQRPVPEGEELATVVASRTASLLTRYAGNRTVEEAEIFRRVKMCEKCPARASWADHCPPCKKKVFKIIDAMFSPVEVAQPMRGQACTLACDDLSVAVRVNDGFEVDSPPGECWRKKVGDD